MNKAPTSLNGWIASNNPPPAKQYGTGWWDCIIVGVGTYSIPVTATDVSGNSGSITNTRTFTANGLSTTLAYDLSGNQTLKSNATSVLTFGWDGANRCVAITNGIYRTAIAHDGANRWTHLVEYSNSVVIADRRFIWNGVTLAEERDAGNNVVQRFYSDGFWRGGTNYFYVKDHLGSVREVYDANGVLQARFDYDPYGTRTQTYGTLKGDFGFAGLFELPNGIKLAVWRIYDPQTARWGSKDPIKEQGGLNLYAYCGGDPVNKIDPSGLILKAKDDLYTHELAIALGYLRQSDTMKPILDFLESPEVGTLSITITARLIKSRHRAKDNELVWAFRQGIQEQYWVGPNRRISPALVLAHELVHLYNNVCDPDAVRARKAIPRAFWDNEEEKLTIHIESVIAHELGEQLRRTHKGREFLATGLTSNREAPSTTLPWWARRLW